MLESSVFYLFVFSKQCIKRKSSIVATSKSCLLLNNTSHCIKFSIASREVKREMTLRSTRCRKEEDPNYVLLYSQGAIFTADDDRYSLNDSLHSISYLCHMV